MIIRAEKRIEWFITHHLDRLPDISDVPTIPDKRLQWWLLSKPKKKKDR